jgi:ribosomal protein L40E
MRCSKCGNQLPDDSVFCNKCGSRVKREKEDDVFAHVCPICKTPNHKEAKYCIKCGHWLLDSKFQAKSINEKEYYKQFKGSSKKLPIILYALFALLFVLVPIDMKILLALLISIYGIINVIVPLKSLRINKRRTGLVIFLIGFIILIVCSGSYSNTNAKAKGNVSYDNLARETELTGFFYKHF